MQTYVASQLRRYTAKSQYKNWASYVAPGSISEVQVHIWINYRMSVELISYKINLTPAETNLDGGAIVSVEDDWISTMPPNCAICL